LYKELRKFVLSKIFEAKGCIVIDANRLSGKRYIRSDKKGYFKLPIRKCQRKDNNSALLIQRRS
jgi:hypothetical protein